jgi:hypothetical protein
MARCSRTRKRSIFGGACEDSEFAEQRRRRMVISCLENKLLPEKPKNAILISGVNTHAPGF